MRSFKAGDLVTLKVASGIINASGGEMGIVVEADYYPEYYKQLVNSLGKKDADELFTAVAWLPSYGGPTPYDGFYMKHRIEVFKEAIKA